MTLPLSAYLDLESCVLAWAAGQGWRLQRTGPLRRGEWPLPRLEFLRDGVLTPGEWDAALAASPLFMESVSGKREARSQEGAAAFARVGLPCVPPSQRNPEVFTMLAGVPGD
ncbi:MAG: hypothetical protein B7Z70_16200 [Acidithiobacillus ferrivorans]|uniref:Uncharacterized protein n=1 Tax=Acidithiobacillus ferrivorans TaxID=160808 RepID=A0A257SEN7_9PROT|nr:MAG: hypothetical protein B7Z70_16200 [Acidithiobacillus ferrivorans]